MIVHTCEQRSDEWFAVKKGKFSASEAQAVATAGKGLQTLVYKKAAELLFNEDADQYENPDLERGVEYEALARTAYEIQTGNIVTQVGFVELDEYTGCSPDGLVGGDGLVEFKCQRGYKFLETRETKNIEPQYIWQMQFQMFVADRKWCDFVSFVPTAEELVIIRVDRDEEAIAKIKKGLVEGIKLLKGIIK